MPSIPVRHLGFGQIVGVEKDDDIAAALFESEHVRAQLIRFRSKIGDPDVIAIVIVGDNYRKFHLHSLSVSSRQCLLS